MQKVGKYFFFLSISIIMFNCKKPYAPPAITAVNHYLVVDGYINANTNDITTINLSRSRSLGDSVTNIPELKAHISIESNAGNTYDLNDVSNNGTYTSVVLNLNRSNQYRLKITTADGNQYLSDYVPVKISPPIDSLSWKQYSDSSLNIFVNSHDPTNNTRYYKWDYIETWESHAQVLNYWGVSNGLIYYIDSTNQINKCWSNANSTNIITGTSAALSEDVISSAPLAVIPVNDKRLFIRYSILAKQMPLTQDAYNYWLIIQKNSQQLGTLFDLQPSQLSGNLHCTTNPAEPVIGFVSACTTVQQRLFVTNSQLYGWNKTDLGVTCNTKIIPTNPSNYLIYTYPDTTYAPYYFTGGPPPALIIITKECVDCRLKGGNTIKPSFW